MFLPGEIIGDSKVTNTLGSMRALSDSQIETIHAATERLLAQTGFVVQHAGVLVRLRQAGARVEETSGRVRMDPSLFRELVAGVPASYVMRNLLGETHRIGGDAPAVGNAIVTDPWIIDYQTGHPRHPALDDVRRHTIIAQQLESVASVSRMDYPVTDIRDATSSLKALETHLLNHALHYWVMPVSLESWSQWLEIGAILARGEIPTGLFTCGVALRSPLTLTEMNAELLLSAVTRGCTVDPTICPMAGSTAPYSLAGALLQANAETLAVAVTGQALRRGSALFYCLGPSVTDMRHGHDLYYTLDKVLWKIASAQLGRSYGLPAGAECGGSLTWRYDVQCGAEGMLFMLAAHACGASVLSGFGSFHNANGMSGEMMVIQDAYLKAARFLARGIATDDFHLALENIQAVGPGGNFLTDDLSLALLRGDEFFRSEIFDYSGGREGGKAMLERAHDYAEKLVAGFKSPVPADIQEALRRYFHDQYAQLAPQMQMS